MASRWLKARQTKYAAYAFAYVLVVITAVVVANILGNRYNKSLDTTSNKRYSLSPQTAKIVKGLKQNATITYFNQSTRFSEGKDLLDEYANLRRVSMSITSIRIRTPSWHARMEFATSAPPLVQIGARKTLPRA